MAGSIMSTARMFRWCGPIKFKLAAAALSDIWGRELQPSLETPLELLGRASEGESFV
jgi:hypothetical protein